MSLFTDFFLAHADCLSAEEKGRALDAAAAALKREPTGVRSFHTRQDLLTRGELHPAADDPVDFRHARAAAVGEWVVAAETPDSIRAIADSLSAAACALAEQHGLCQGCWHDTADCTCARVLPTPTEETNR